MAIKAVFFDVDGTLVSFKTHKIPDSALKALHTLQAKGVKIFVSTGRHPGMLHSLMELFPFDGVVAVNGQICRMGDTVLRSNPLEREQVQALLKAKEEMGFHCIFLAEGEEMFFSEADPVMYDFWDTLKVPVPPVKPAARALEIPVYQVITFLSPEEEGELFARAPQLNHTRWTPLFVDIIPSGGGKDAGLQAVMDHLGLAREEVMAFGDGENDLSMIRHAGIGVVMASGTDYLKSQGDYVAPDVDEDGVARTLAYFGLL